MGSVIWKNAEDQLLVSCIDKGLSWSEIADLIDGRNAEGCRKRAYNLRRMNKFDELRDEVKSKTSEELIEQNEGVVKRLSNYKRAYANKQRRNEEIPIFRMELVMEEIVKYLQLAPPVEYVGFDPAAYDSDVEEEEICCLCSDVHLGLCFSSDTLGGVPNEYNIEIAKACVRKYFDALLKLVKERRKLRPSTKLNLFLLGDLIHGSINVGKWGNAHMEAVVADQVCECIKLFVGELIKLAGAFKQIAVYCVPGNHSRITKNGESELNNNFEHILYHSLETAVTLNNPNKFTFHISREGKGLIRDICGHTFGIIHGDDIKVNKSGVQSLISHFGTLNGSEPFHQERLHVKYALAGHFHTSGYLVDNGITGITNGDFIAGDYHSVSSGYAIGNRLQKIFGLSRSKGITWVQDININLL